ncbi:MAG: dUTP diphosphatase [Chitinophagaceae bacterium]
MEMVTVKILNQSGNPLPGYATTGSAGMDLRANLETAIVLGPLQRSLVPTGLFIELPEGFEAQVRPRSGLAIKYGITCLNSPGTVDSDYRGELKVILINLSDQPFTINHGERIAQMVIHTVQTIQWQTVEFVSETSRNHGGFGHTGV